MTHLDAQICHVLHTLRTLRQELAGQRQSLEFELHVARQTEGRLTQQIDALTAYLVTGGPDVQAALAALGSAL
jgi:hypothetical protein